MLLCRGLAFKRRARAGVETPPPRARAGHTPRRDVQNRGAKESRLRRPAGRVSAKSAMRLGSSRARGGVTTRAGGRSRQACAPARFPGRAPGREVEHLVQEAAPETTGHSRDGHANRRDLEVAACLGGEPAPARVSPAALAGPSCARSRGAGRNRHSPRLRPYLAEVSGARFASALSSAEAQPSCILETGPVGASAHASVSGRWPSPRGAAAEEHSPRARPSRTRRTNCTSRTWVAPAAPGAPGRTYRTRS